MTKLQRDAKAGGALHEMNFWHDMEKAVQGLNEQMASPAIALTMEILRRKQRFMSRRA